MGWILIVCVNKVDGLIGFCRRVLYCEKMHSLGLTLT